MQESLSQQPNIRRPENTLDMIKSRLDFAMSEAVELTDKIHRLEEELEKLNFKMPAKKTMGRGEAKFSEEKIEEVYEEKSGELKILKENLEEKWAVINKLQTDYINAGGVMEDAA